MRVQNETNYATPAIKAVLHAMWKHLGADHLGVTCRVVYADAAVKVGRINSTTFRVALPRREGFYTFELASQMRPAGSLNSYSVWVAQLKAQAEHGGGSDCFIAHPTEEEVALREAVEKAVRVEARVEEAERKLAHYRKRIAFCETMAAKWERRLKARMRKLEGT
jgi:hypothetical protein